MHRTMKRLAAHEALEKIDIQAVSICDHKYFKIMSDRYTQRLDFLENRIDLEPEEVRFDTAQEWQKKTDLMKEQLAHFKRVNYGR